MDRIISFFALVAVAVSEFFDWLRPRQPEQVYARFDESGLVEYESANLHLEFRNFL